MVGVGRYGWGCVAVTAKRTSTELSDLLVMRARGSILIQDRMSKLNVFVHRLLHKVGVLLPSRLWDDMPYELLNSGVDVFLASARHGRIFALLFF